MPWFVLINVLIWDTASVVMSGISHDSISSLRLGIARAFVVQVLHANFKGTIVNIYEHNWCSH